jgi:alpha-ketoglutarate-dependent taurine dioxygenase
MPVIHNFQATETQWSRFDRERIEAMSNVESFRAKKISQKRSPVDLSAIELVSIELLNAQRPFPLVVRPAFPGVDIVEWAAMNRTFIETKLYKHGALLFRGFAIDSSTTFEAFAHTCCPTLFGNYGDLPKEDGSDRIYHSTPYPNTKTILFHNESSHLVRWPMKQFFYCVQPAQSGGETPIVDCREVYKQLASGLAVKMIDKGLTYIRNFIPGYDVKWQDFFRTDDQKAVEAICQQEGVEYEWKGNSLRTRQHRAAAAKHPKTGEHVFFNQIQLHHVSALDTDIRDALLRLLPFEDLPRNVCYGDGSSIEDEVVKEITASYWESSVAFAWERGDVLMVDNMLMAHARNPYMGDRKIVVAMGEMVSSSST